MLFLDSLKFNLGGVKASVGITCHLNGPMKRLLLRLTLYCLQLLFFPSVPVCNGAEYRVYRLMSFNILSH